MSLQLHLELNKNKVTLGHLPEVTLRLYNSGHDEKLINSRMLLVPAHSPDRLKEVEFHFITPKGVVNLKKFAVNRKKSDKNNFARLLPGEYIIRSYDLSKYYSYKAKGRYKITGYYQNQVDLEINNLTSWQGKLQSNEKQFEVYEE